MLDITDALVAKWEQIPTARLQPEPRRVEAVIEAGYCPVRCSKSHTDIVFGCPLTFGHVVCAAYLMIGTEASVELK